MEIGIAIARKVEHASLILPYVIAIDEAERRLKVRANLLEHEIAAPRLVREAQRQRRGIVVARRTREAALVIGIGLNDVAAKPIRVAVLEIHAANTVACAPGRIAVG